MLHLHYPILIEDALKSKIKLMSNTNYPNSTDSKLLRQKLKLLESLKKTKGGDFGNYHSFKSEERILLSQISIVVTEACSHTIHSHLMSLGIDNYSIHSNPKNTAKFMHFLHNGGPTCMLDKYKELMQSHLSSNTPVYNERENSESYVVNKQVLSAIFRSDPIVNQEAAIMIKTIMSFVLKKANNLGSRRAIERCFVDYEELFNVGVMGYLSTTTYWNPYREANNMSHTSFLQCGWYDAKASFYTLFNGMRLIRFPFNIEEIINKVHNRIKKRYNELVSLDKTYSHLEIQLIIANEMKTDIDQVKSIFKLFASTSSALPLDLPRYQHLIRLDKPMGDEGTMTLVDIVESHYDCTQLEENSNNQMLSNTLIASLKGLDVLHRTVLKLRYGLGVTPYDWQYSGAKAITRMKYSQVLNKQHTLETIGKYLNLSREQVRQVESKAIRNLRNPQVNKNLKSFLYEQHTEKITVEKTRIQLEKEYMNQSEELDKKRFMIKFPNQPIPSQVEQMIQLLDQLYPNKSRTNSELILLILNRLITRLTEGGIVDRIGYSYTKQVIKELEKYNSYNINLHGEGTYYHAYQLLYIFYQNFKQSRLTCPRNDVNRLFDRLIGEPLYLMVWIND